MAKKYATYYFDEEIIEQMKILADARGIKISVLVEELILKELEEYKEVIDFIKKVRSKNE